MSGRPYSALGEVLDELARKRDVRGPHRIANYVKARFPDAPSGVAVSKWMYGEASPTPENVRRFAEAFELSEGEKTTLSFAFTYGQEPPKDV
ncbi:MAG: helix-turn-helix transcriptional regulator [Actinobacteria bacterium]|nr:helix-turn-helix transcriptional regulator [Actinomycetota bacterium]